MDTARQTGTGRTGRWRRFLRTALPLTVVASGCALITGDLDRIIGIEIEGGLQRSVEEGDSLQLVARGISAGGDTVSDAGIVWELLPSDSTPIGFELDAGTGLIRALAPGTGHVRPRTADITPRDSITVVVTGAPDSVASAGDQTVTMTAGAATSPPMTVELQDLTTAPDAAVPLADKEVQFLVIQPAPGSAEAAGFFLVAAAADTLPREDPHALTVVTDGAGLARAVVRRASGAAVPDSTVVHAVAFTATGRAVAGSPVRFVVIFEKN